MTSSEPFNQPTNQPINQPVCHKCGGVMYRSELRENKARFKCSKCGTRRLIRYTDLDIEQLNRTSSGKRKADNYVTDEFYDTLLSGCLANEESVTKDNQQMKDGYVHFPSLLAIREDGTLMSAEEYCAFHRIDFNTVSKAVSVTHQGKPYYNLRFVFDHNLADAVSEEHLKELIGECVKPVKFVPYEQETKNVTRLIISDAHIGMSPNKDGSSMYNLRWDKETQERDFRKMTSHVISTAQPGMLIIDDLGDLPDGFNEQTARGGHHLPQNMNNAEMFDNCVKYKINMVREFVNSGKFYRIDMHNVCNDNHNGDFAYFINQYLKGMLETMYPQFVHVHNYREFIFHYTVGQHTFILSHGKDKQSLKYGFKVNLDSAGKDKINGYILAKGINSKYIEFSKGNDHQCLFDYCSSPVFTYMNYPALCPASQHVQDNYQLARRGYVVQRFDKEKRNIDVDPVFL